MRLNENLISLIIPTYKGAKTLPKLVEELISIFKDYKIEIIIVNDCSPDNTHKDSEILLNKYPNKITYLKLSKNVFRPRVQNHSKLLPTMPNLDVPHFL